MLPVPGRQLLKNQFPATCIVLLSNKKTKVNVKYEDAACASLCILYMYIMMGIHNNTCRAPVLSLLVDTQKLAFFFHRVNVFKISWHKTRNILFQTEWVRHIRSF